MYKNFKIRKEKLKIKKSAKEHYISHVVMEGATAWADDEPEKSPNLIIMDLLNNKFNHLNPLTN